MLSVRRGMSALRYVALMSCGKRMRARASSPLAVQMHLGVPVLIASALTAGCSATTARDVVIHGRVSDGSGGPIAGLQIRCRSEISHHQHAGGW
jgi:hypothetical protein